MAYNDALYRCEPNTRARILLPSVQALERAKQFVHICHVETGPIVAHKIGPGPVVGHFAEVNLRQLLFTGEFPCVAQQIVEDDPQ